jgi:L-alanine-DL-glutamate epimerase-like enolase superfamily enzyme
MGECGPIPGLSSDDLPDFAEQVERVCALLTAGRLASPALGLAAHHAELASNRLPSLVFGLETALQDLANGGRQRLWETPFSRGETGLSTHGLIWMESVAGLLAQIERKVAAGHTVVKLKVGALPSADELALLQAMRRRWTAAALEVRLDANGAFDSVAEAEARLADLAPLGIRYLEQPLAAGRHAETAYLCRCSPVPLVLDEELIGVAPAAAGTLLQQLRPSGIILKPSLLGGFSAAETWLAQAEMLGIRWWTNSLLESNIGLNAICQWTAHVDPAGATVHGLGTGQLFVENLPPAMQLAGATIWWRG